jgi:hypothetical protein
MKKLAYLLVSIISIYCMTGIISSKADASDFIGDFCWDVVGDGSMLKLGVSNLGGQHYLLTGKIINKSDKTLQNIINGNVEFIGTKYYGTLVNAGKDNTAMWTGTNFITLNDSDLNGTIESIGHDHNYKDLSTDTEYTSGLLTSIPCP